MTTSEFRQVLVDLGSYLDARKGTNLASQFSALTDSALAKLYSVTPNPLQLRSAAEGLKESDVAKAGGAALPAARTAGKSLTPMAVAGSCAPGAIIDNSAGSNCTPSYPDPNNTAWQNMVNPVITFGGLSGSYAAVSTESCSLTVESNLVQVVAALNGTVSAASLVCSALNADPVGGSVAAGVCDIPVSVAAVAGAISQGLLADCFEQDADINAAEIDAGFRNTVTIFNALGADFTALGTRLTSVDNDINSHITTVNNQITGEFNAASTQLTNVNNQITSEFTTVGNQITQATDLLQAYLKQIMKLELTPDGQKVINPAILTCTGANCPNVLARCPAAGCTWNNAGPLP
jgi:hypothetical protein